MDKKRILVKFAELEGYVEELKKVSPKSFKEYQTSIEKRRATERLLHISIECVIDVCGILVSELRLGLPSRPEDFFEKLKAAGVITHRLAKKLAKMKSFRNIIVHRYGTVDDELVFKTAHDDMKDFSDFKKEILKFLKEKS